MSIFASARFQRHFLICVLVHRHGWVDFAEWGAPGNSHLCQLGRWACSCWSPEFSWGFPGTLLACSQLIPWRPGKWQWNLLEPVGSLHVSETWFRMLSIIYFNCSSFGGFAVPYLTCDYKLQPFCRQFGEIPDTSVCCLQIADTKHWKLQNI